MSRVPDVYVDGDGCPVKEDVYKVAHRYGLTVFMVCNSPLRVPKDSWIKPIVVGSDFDAVDNWICEKIQKGDVAITNDILLAKRCIDKEAFVLDPRGRELNPDNVGDALATRELMSELRQSGAMNLGPKAMKSRDKSLFLRTLDEVINKAKRSLT